MDMLMGRGYGYADGTWNMRMLMAFVVTKYTLGCTDSRRNLGMWLLIATVYQAWIWYIPKSQIEPLFMLTDLEQQTACHPKICRRGWAGMRRERILLLSASR